MDREDLEQVDNLRYTWQQLIARAMETNCLLLSLQPHFADDLCHNLECFRHDTIQYCHDYRTSGPMMPGLTPREASDRLLLFQVGFIFLDTLVHILFNIFVNIRLSAKSLLHLVKYTLGSEVMKIQGFWNIMPFRLINSY